MTTFGLAEMEALGLLEKKHKTSVRVTNTITNHPDMLTDKELEVKFSSLNPKKLTYGLLLGCHRGFSIFRDRSQGSYNRDKSEVSITF